MPASKVAYPQDTTGSGLSSREGVVMGGGNLVGETEESSPQEILPLFALITDGSQFRRLFWEDECNSLQRLMNKQQARHPPFQFKPVPNLDELEKMDESEEIRATYVLTSRTSPKVAQP